jgi:hypothetical protein
MIVLSNCFEDSQPIQITFTSFINPVCETSPFSITTYQGLYPIETLSNCNPSILILFRPAPTLMQTPGTLPCTASIENPLVSAKSDYLFYLSLNHAKET